MIEYNEILQSAYKMLKEYNRTDTVYTHSEIKEMAESICNMPKFKSYKSLILNQIIDMYEENINTKAYEPDILSLNNDDTKWFFDKKGTIATPYFDRYAQYLSDQDFAEDTIKKIKESTEKILLKCADPTNETAINKKKKGLVVGDVQSGKTSNYLALINMACDYGYKLIVLLAGMTDSLRKQTQKRIDAGFIGAISESIGSSDTQYIGVGLEDNKHYSVPFTNGKSDFNKIVKENQNSTVSDYTKPVILVVKKNASVLNHVIDAINAKEQKQLDRKNVLIIDDEADNASINTSNPDKNPSTINRCIRKIFNNYDIATYVGFTATPFANIFINPEDDETFKDLFPSDFIVQLNSPDNYFGTDKVFKNDGAIQIIHDYEENFLPTIHKKDFMYAGLSESLIEAINCFIINNVLRTLDGAGKKHRSMMINISVFNDVQNRIYYQINEYLQKVKNVFDQEGHLETQRLIKNKYAKKIYDLYHSEFYNNEKARGRYNWEQIKKKILEELQLIEVKIFNKTTSKNFNYDEYSNGARVIVVGGFVLSRGLTLEGLMVSYYNRRTSMYDTMLQMCRWFGYRPKYEHLCRIYMTESNKENFLAVIEATADLKEQFQRMSMRGAKPSEFGLMVKESPDTLETSLLITAKNKLKNSKEIVRTLNYSGIPVDTSKLFKDKQKNDDNRQKVFAFVLELENKGKFVENKDGRYIISDVDHKDIAKFIKLLNVSYYNTKFDTESLSEYIFNSDMKKWDIAFATGEKSSKRYIFNGHELVAPQRRFLYGDGDEVIKIGGSNNRLVEPGIFNAGLTDVQKETAKQNAEKLYNEGIRKNKNVTARDYLDIQGRKPLLAIYPIEILAKEEDNEKAVEIAKMYEEELVYGFALGFPGKNTKVEVKYRINKIKLQEIINANEEPDEDEEYED